MGFWPTVSCPFYIAKSSLKTYFTPSPPPLALFATPTTSLRAPMSTSQIRCQGCDRVFSPRGLSQHLSRTPNAVCREVQTTSRTPSLFQTVSGAGSSLASNSNEANPRVHTTADAVCREVQLTPRPPSLFQTVSSTRSSLVLNSNEADLEAIHMTDAADVADTDIPADPMDSTDADLLEEIGNGQPSPTIPQQGQPVEAQTPNHATPPPIESQPPSPAPIHHTEPDANSLDTTPAQVFVKRFPFGSPGAPITGAHQGTTIYKSNHKVFGESIWAPFHSECDWEIARWAKMRGPSSSAMEELLAIPSVRLTD